MLGCIWVESSLITPFLGNTKGKKLLRNGTWVIPFGEGSPTKEFPRPRLERWRRKIGKGDAPVWHPPPSCHLSDHTLVCSALRMQAGHKTIKWILQIMFLKWCNNCNHGRGSTLFWLWLFFKLWHVTYLQLISNWIRRIIFQIYCSSTAI